MDCTDERLLKHCRNSQQLQVNHQTCTVKHDDSHLWGLCLVLSFMTTQVDLIFKELGIRKYIPGKVIK